MSNCQKDVKMSKICQCPKDVKLSKQCQMSKSQTAGLVKFKIKLNTMRFTHNDVNFDVTHESQQNWSKNILQTFWGFLMTPLPAMWPFSAKETGTGDIKLIAHCRTATPLEVDLNLKIVSIFQMKLLSGKIHPPKVKLYTVKQQTAWKAVMAWKQTLTLMKRPPHPPKVTARWLRPPTAQILVAPPHTPKVTILTDSEANSQGNLKESSRPSFPESQIHKYFCKLCVSLPCSRSLIK